MNDTGNQLCPQCGQPMAAGYGGSICPACLLKQGLAENTEGFTDPAQTTRAYGDSPSGPGAGGGGRGWQPPAVEQIQAHFPELEILHLLGRGGMGAVYQARQKNLNRLVALKILPPQIGRDASFAERFTREAQAMARLSHPHIVTIHDFGHKEPQGPGAGLYYFVMEYVDGLNLRQVLDAAKMSAGEALGIVPQICEALQYAHDQGIVHRDIKPENILLNKQGQVKIADFGLAKLIAPGSFPGTMAGDSEITNPKSQIENPVLTEAAVGTPNYMAPEQRERPTQVDHRADIYALGVVFYQMLTGELPKGRFEPPSRKVRIDVRLDEVVLRALEREPSRRYQHVSEIQTEVETIVSTPPGSADRTSEGAANKEHTQHAASFSAAALSGGGGGGEARFSRTAIVGAAWFGACVFGVLTLSGGGIPSDWPLWEQLFAYAVIGVTLTAPIGVTICGIISLSQIRHAAGRLYGLGLAVFDAMFFPLLVFDIAIAATGLLCLRLVGLSGTWAQIMPMFSVVWLALILTADALLIRWAWRAANKPLGLNPASRPSDPWSAIRREQGDAAAHPLAGRSPRPWWKRWWGQLIAAVVIAIVVRALVMPTYVIAGNAMAPELPAGSRILVWKLTWHFEQGDLVAYHDANRVKVGRVVRVEADTVVVNRNAQPEQTVERSSIIGKVFSVFWRGKDQSHGASSREPQSMPPASSFGPVIERTVHDDHPGSTDFLIDLDTGRLVTPSPGEQADWQWVASNGIDATGAADANVRGLSATGGTVVVPVANDAWDQFTVGHLWQMLEALSSTEKVMVAMPAKDGVPATFAFKTREGGKGLLQIVGFTDNPRGVRIRYKLVEPGEEHTSPTQWLAEAGIDMNAMLDAAPCVQIMIQDVQPDGGGRFRSVFRQINRSDQPLETLRFINSDFVDVQRMWDARFQPLVFDVTHDSQQRIYRYAAKLPERIAPGGVLVYATEGTMNGKVKRQNDGTFAYDFRHWPSTGAATRRVEVHVLPAGATVLSLSPHAKQMTRGQDGRVIVKLDQIVPAGGSVELSYRYQLPPEAAASSFGPVIERTVNDLDDKQGDEGLNFHDGKLVSLPADFGGPAWNDQSRQKWCDDNGVDLMVERAQDRWGFMVRGVKFGDLDAAQWERVTLAEVDTAISSGSKRCEVKSNRSGTFMILPADTQPPLVFAFKTPGGERGVLQIAAFSAGKPWSMKIRYKLVESGQAKARPAGTIEADRLSRLGAMLEALGQMSVQAGQAAAAGDFKTASGLWDQAVSHEQLLCEASRGTKVESIILSGVEIVRQAGGALEKKDAKAFQLQLKALQAMGTTVVDAIEREGVPIRAKSARE